jgi:hypothetical protein
MPGFPANLLPNTAYPAMLSSSDVLSYFFVRETQDDLYVFLLQDMLPADFIHKLIEPQPSLNEVFELSLFLFGYYSADCFGIRVDDAELNHDWDGSSSLPTGEISFSKKEVFPLFLYVNKLYKKRVSFFDEEYVLSFSHKPKKANYWHFQLFTQDSQGEYIPKDKHNSRTKKLAKHLFENFIMNAICRNKVEVVPFNRSDFDG